MAACADGALANLSGAVMAVVADALSLLANLVMAWNTMTMQSVLDRWNAEKRYLHSEQNGPCIQQVIEVPGIFAHVFANKVPALLARKSRVPQVGVQLTSVLPAALTP